MKIDTLPRLLDLENRFRSNDRQNFFANFRNRLAGHRVTYDYYHKVDRWLSFIPADVWDDYCAKVGKVCNSFDRIRHWEKLHDVFNEALGAKLLACRYRCKMIEMIKPSTHIRKKSPDWRGHTKYQMTFVEVKTINHSQDERESWYQDTTLCSISELSIHLKNKITSSYTEACEQLNAVAARSERKVVLFVLNQDYNLDPIDHDIGDLVIEYLDTLERGDVTIFAHIQGP